jgi:hypothetical protein
MVPPALRFRTVLADRRRHDRPLYGYGDPGFNGHRPASLDRPLRDSHFAVNSGARDVQRILIAIDNGVPRLRMPGNHFRRVGEALAPARY